jgi:hypothetical protein
MMNKNKLTDYAICVFFLVYLIVGILIFKDYGAGYDELINRDLGVRTYDYITERLTGNWSSPADQFFSGTISEKGPLYETILVSLENFIQDNDTNTIIKMRHLFNFLTFWFGSLIFYFLLLSYYDDKLLSLFGTMLYVFMPRLFAHSFFNSVDTIFTTFFVISMFTMDRLLKNFSWHNLIINATASAATCCVRIVGLILPLLTLAILLNYFIHDNAVDRRKRLLFIVGYFLFFILQLLLFWPQLWENPYNFFEMIKGISSAKQFDNNFTLYAGEFINVNSLPYYYLLVWIAITTPLSILTLFFIGLYKISIDLRTEPFTSKGNINNLLQLIWIFAPILAVIIKKPILYDDWRHFYFIYPAIVIIAVRGTNFLMSIKYRFVITSSMLLIVLHLSYNLIIYHPYQNVYFNVLAGSHIDQNWELDYWGISYKEGLNKVLSLEEKDKNIRVAFSDYPGFVNYLYLERDKRNKLIITTNLDEADYFISNHRQPIHHSAFVAKSFPYNKVIFSVNRNNADLLTVSKIR